MAAGHADDDIGTIRPRLGRGRGRPQCDRDRDQVKDPRCPGSTAPWSGTARLSGTP
jgi:hypothetical protein